MGTARRSHAVSLKWRYSALIPVFLHSYKHFLFVSLCRPFIMTAQEPVIILLGTYLAFIYGIIYCALLRHDCLFLLRFKAHPTVSQWYLQHSRRFIPKSITRNRGLWVCSISRSALVCTSAV